MSRDDRRLCAVVVAAAAGSSLVQRQGTHNRAQNDLDAGHRGSVEEVKVCYAIAVRLALRCDMRLAVVSMYARERLDAHTSGCMASECPDEPTFHTRLSSALKMLCCCCTSLGGGAAVEAAQQCCMHRPATCNASDT